MLMNIGDKVTLSKSGLLTTIAWQINNKVCYALEGSVFIGGAVVQWLRDEMHLIEHSADSEKMAKECHGTHGVYIVPAFTGLGTPYWDDDARGAIFGLTRSTSNKHIIRASLEAIAYQCRDVFEVMKKESHFNLSKLKVDGGATSNGYLMQFQSDILQIEITKPKCLESTALGVCYMAGYKAGFFKGPEHIKECHSYQKTYKPLMSAEKAKLMAKSWEKAVDSARNFKI
jgi:glycerol kinase